MRRLLLFITLLGMLGCVTSAPVAPAGPRGNVAYMRNGDLWVQDLPHGARRRLTSGGGYGAPTWSGSGQWILLGAKDGYVTVRSDGSETHPLPAGASRPVWSPVDDRLAYLDQQGRPTIGRPDGTEARPVADEINAGGPAWSPDGRWLAFTKGAPDRSYAGIWRVPADGGRPQEVYGKRGQGPQCLMLGPWVSSESILSWNVASCSSSITADGLPLMSVSPTAHTPARQVVDDMLVYPDFLAVGPGGRLAVAEGNDRQTWTNKRIVVTDSHSRTVSPADMAAISPVWSADGRHIAFVAMPDIGSVGGGEPARKGMMQRRIWTVGPDGTGLHRLTEDPKYRDEAPRWTEDGGHILFCRLDEQTKASLWIAAKDGGAPHKVADIDAPENWFGYYGYVGCSRFFDYWGDEHPPRTFQH